MGRESLVEAEAGPVRTASEAILSAALVLELRLLVMAGGIERRDGIAEGWARGRLVDPTVSCVQLTMSSLESEGNATEEG